VFLSPLLFSGAVRLVSVENNKRNVSKGSRLGTNCDAMLMNDIINTQNVGPKNTHSLQFEPPITHNKALDNEVHGPIIVGISNPTFTFHHWFGLIGSFG
jgi:hypothetical protein